MRFNRLTPADYFPAPFLVKERFAKALATPATLCGIALAHTTQINLFNPITHLIEIIKGDLSCLSLK
ncbi:hypothetical protein SG34_022105 [Thalassomonas viridans]|uniref:Uncharacterized protein n=1 Tax=Thalassomonas viridans TaxID=137584 RepID=A0AAF0C662_9GAMM|nr:hypothetical protein [Thalassomonas viridans]WDE04032.1 hypothetical protein SG34_022105 [Thalassomonas viridans]